jgi:hypothetical protein
MRPHFTIAPSGRQPLSTGTGEVPGAVDFAHPPGANCGKDLIPNAGSPYTSIFRYSSFGLVAIQSFNALTIPLASRTGKEKASGFFGSK